MIAAGIGWRSRHGRPFYEAAAMIVLSAVLYQLLGDLRAWQALYVKVADIPWIPFTLAAAVGGAAIGWAGWNAGRQTSSPGRPQLA